MRVRAASEQTARSAGVRQATAYRDVQTELVVLTINRLRVSKIFVGEGSSATKGRERVSDRVQKPHLNLEVDRHVGV